MGGGAFARAYAPGEPTLRTPRMSPEEYRRLKDASLEKLEDYLPNSQVAVLIEAPEKADYGDIDLLIATPNRVDLVDVANHLGAAGVICHNAWKASLAVPHVAEDYSRPTVVYKAVTEPSKQGDAASSNTTCPKAFAQIDIEIVSPELLQWYKWYSSYGDMASLVGHIVTQLGFTVNDRGLWLRLEELDLSKTAKIVNVADRDGKIFLSSDPGLVTEFLGCSKERYAAGFNTLNELYEWLGSCRLLSPEALKIKRDNAHERHREHTRPIYNRFFNEWLPTRMDLTTTEDEQERDRVVRQLRNQYLQEAIDFFSVREEYETKHAALALAIDNGHAAALIRPLVAEHSKKGDKQLNEIMRAFRRFVAFDEILQPRALELPHTDAESELRKFLDADKSGLREPEATSEWVKANWERLRALERQRSR